MHRNTNAEGFLCFESKLAAPHGHRGQAGGQRATIHSRVGTKQPPSPQTPPPAQAQPQTQQHNTARSEGSEAWDHGTLFDREFLLTLSLGLWSSFWLSWQLYTVVVQWETHCYLKTRRTTHRPMPRYGGKNTWPSSSFSSGHSAQGAWSRRDGWKVQLRRGHCLIFRVISYCPHFLSPHWFSPLFHRGILFLWGEKMNIFGLFTEIFCAKAKLSLCLMITSPKRTWNW